MLWQEPRQFGLTLPMISLREPSVLTSALFGAAVLAAFWLGSVPLALAAIAAVILWLAFGVLVARLRPDIVREKQRRTGVPETGSLSGEQYYVRIVLICLLAYAAWEFFRTP